MAIYRPIPGFKGRTFKLCVLTRKDFTFSVCSSPQRGRKKERKKRQKKKKIFKKSLVCTCCSLNPSPVKKTKPPPPRSGELRTQKLKSHLVRTQSLNVLPLKPGIGQYIAIHATLTARDFFLAYFYPSGPVTCIFSKTSPDFSCVGYG